MSNIEEFKARLVAGDFASITGARKSISKTQGWSEQFKNKARALAEEHFGEGAAPAKAAKKTAPKAVKAAKPAKEEKAAKVEKAAPKKRAGRPASSGPTGDSVLEQHDAITKGMQHSLVALRDARDLGASADIVAAAATKAQEVLSRSIDSVLGLLGTAAPAAPPADTTNLAALASAAAAAGVSNGAFQGFTPPAQPALG